MAESGSYGRAALITSPVLRPDHSEGPRSAEWVRDNFDTILALHGGGENAVDEQWSFMDQFGKKNTGTPFGRKKPRRRSAL